MAHWKSLNRLWFGLRIRSQSIFFITIHHSCSSTFYLLEHELCYVHIWTHYTCFTVNSCPRFFKYLTSLSEISIGIWKIGWTFQLVFSYWRKKYFSLMIHQLEFCYYLLWFFHITLTFFFQMINCFSHNNYWTLCFLIKMIWYQIRFE